MSQKDEERKFLRIYFRNGFPVSAVDSDGKRYSPHRVKHSKHMRNRRNK